jgi:hypothetical protein
MTLPNDVSRCSGENAHSICKERNECKRYKALATPADWHVLHSQFYQPEKKVCENKL